MYVRHGLLMSNYKAYCGYLEATYRESLRIGKDTFASILSACSLKGTNNQGLSNYYTDFLEAIKISDDLLDQLRKLASDKTHLSKQQREELKEVLELVETRNDHTNSYLVRKDYYGDLAKESTNGYNCDCHALGETCIHPHSFDPSSGVCLAFLNHVMIGWGIDQAMRALPESQQCTMRLLTNSWCFEIVVSLV
jgi:hypothetical protein